MLLSGHLSVGALSQDFEQLELRGVGLLTSLLHVVADVDLLQYAVVLGRERERAAELSSHGGVGSGRLGRGAETVAPALTPAGAKQ